MRQPIQVVAVSFCLVLAACTSDGSGEPGSTSDGGQTDGETTTTVASPGDGPYEVCWTAEGGEGPIGSAAFVDRTEELGLLEPLTGMRGHAAAWGDVNGDGYVDLLVGTFATARSDVYLVRGAEGPSPDRLLLGTGDGFEVDARFPEQYGRTSGAALVDLDGDGDVDAILSRNVTGREEGAAATEIFENVDGEFVVVDAGIDPELGGRSIGVVDIDVDGLLDLVILEDRYQGASTRVYRNMGSLAFEDATSSFGFPDGVHGLGLATGDLNNDGFTDLFVAGSNRLFVGTGDGFDEVVGDFQWETLGPEDDVAGAAMADMNRDGRLDLLVGHHFNSTVSRDTEVPVRLYLNTTEGEGSEPSFLDVTDESGLVALPTKAPHVELVDIDNDGWPDILTSASAGEGSSPAVLMHEGLEDGVPQFSVPEGLGSDQYWVTTPTADVDRDGRLDLLAVEWDPSLPSILFANTTSSGNFLEVIVADGYRGVGSRVEVYEAGGMGDPAALLGVREITATVGYTAGLELVAHFGLGDTQIVDLAVLPFGSDEPEIITGVEANRRIAVAGSC